MSIRHGMLTALVALSVAAGCGRVEPSALPLPSTVTPVSALTAVIPQAEPAVQTFVPPTVAETRRLQPTALPTSAPIPRNDTFELYSGQVGDWYKVYVSLPGAMIPGTLTGIL